MDGRTNITPPNAGEIADLKKFENHILFSPARLYFSDSDVIDFFFSKRFPPFVSLVSPHISFDLSVCVSPLSLFQLKKE